MATAAIVIITLCLIGGCVLVIGANNDVNVEGLEVNIEVENEQKKGAPNGTPDESPK